MANKKKSGGGKGRPHHGGNARKRAGSQAGQPRGGQGDTTRDSSPGTRESSTAAPRKSAKQSATSAKKPASDRGPTRQDRIEARRRSKRRRERMSRIGIPVAILVAILAFAIIAKGGSSGTGPSDTGEITVAGQARDSLIPDGESIPIFTAPALGGGEFDLADYEGEPFVLSIWAPWCPHCQKELPIIDRVSRDFPAVPVVTVATAIDQGTVTPESFMAERSLAFPVAIDDNTQTLAEALGVTNFPTIYYVKPDGTVAASETGEVPEEGIEEQFEALDKLVPKAEATPSPSESPEAAKPDKKDS